jgi:hypothetical protein
MIPVAPLHGGWASLDRMISGAKGATIAGISTACNESHPRQARLASGEANH